MDDNLTPGVIDGYAQQVFTQGACAALALVLHEATRWPLISVTDSHNVHDGMAGGGSSLHYMVRHPEGFLLDIDGLHMEDEILDQYNGEADEGEAAIGVTSKRDVEEWYILSQGEPVPLSLARTFVQPVLKMISGNSGE